MLLLDQIYLKFQTRKDCNELLEIIYWGNVPTCPYCYSTKQTLNKGDNRYHCNYCNTAYNVTVSTVFHHSKLDLQKWFYAIFLLIEEKKELSVRKLASELRVNKNTAWILKEKIMNSTFDKTEMTHFEKIIVELKKI